MIYMEPGDTGRIKKADVAKNTSVDALSFTTMAIKLKALHTLIRSISREQYETFLHYLDIAEAEGPSATEKTMGVDGSSVITDFRTLGAALLTAYDALDEVDF